MLKRLIISIKNLMLLSSGNESIIAYASCRRVMYFASDVLEAGPKAVDFYFHEVLPLGLPAMQKFVDITIVETALASASEWSLTL